jgi:amino acid adenylation domain-containing protein/thioester reductase-like protein
MFNASSNNLIHRLFEHQALRTPEAIAVSFEDRQLTYRELNHQANQVAHYLQSLGVQPETLVGICIERSLAMLVAMLAVLKAGGAYVPLDPSYPTERLAFMLEDSELPILLTETAQLAKFPLISARVVVLDRELEEIMSQFREDNLTSDVSGDNVAYTIYTSGSTGNPKGVQVLHGAVVNFLDSMAQEPGLNARDTLLAVTTISFDIAVLELFLPLCVGAKIVLVSRDIAADGVRLAEAIATSGTTFMQATPATWRLLMATGWKGNRGMKILCGGEAMTRSLADRLLDCCESLWNMYGPTETTIWSAVERVEADTEEVSIGYPIANTQIYLIHEHCRRKGDILKLVPNGQPGELYIGGDGLARGYLNRPEMNEQRFVPDPFSDRPEARLYRTGDLARLLPNGKIQFIGRVDHQVKIRGYRIELGDIEAAISQHPDVKEAAVIVREDSTGEKRLIAYVSSHDNSNLQSQLTLHLKQKLPEYMVPSLFVMLEQLPLTPNGKIDRRALPIVSATRPNLGVETIAPRNPTEVKLAAIWSQILDIQEIGINDNFFDLGGNSLSIAYLLGRVENTFEVRVPISDLFANPTIAGLAEWIAASQSAASIPDQSYSLLADLELDPSIVPTGPSIDPTQPPQNILLTGATGFLGAFLLDQLLHSTSAQIYCLIRCSSLAAGKRKLIQNLERYSLTAAAQSNRVIIVSGDLSQPLFGLSPEAFHELAVEIDAIYHNGAFVHLVYPYATLRDTNVLGTQEVLRLASQVKVKPVHFISTLDVFQSTYHNQLDVLAEDDEFPLAGIPESGYAQTKWVAEKLVKIANDRGIPTSIYRPGMIIGHSETGIANTEDQMGKLIRGLIQLGLAPQLSLPMHLTPVDYVTKAIVHLSHQSSSWGQVFHLTNPHALSLDQLVGHIQALGYELEYADYDLWLKTLLDRYLNQQNSLTSLIPLLTSKSEVYSNYLEVLNLDRVSCEQTISALAGTTIGCQPLDAELLDTYFLYFNQSGFLPSPQRNTARPMAGMV